MNICKGIYCLFALYVVSYFRLFLIAIGLQKAELAILNLQ